MTPTIQDQVDGYFAWLRDRTRLRDVDGDWTEITTPFLDRHNDYLQIYVRQAGDSLLLTDDGYVIGDLKLSGCSLETPKRADLLRLALNGFGVRRNGDALEVRATEGDFCLRKHSLVQAMLAVNDLFCLAMPVVASVFLEDVTEWLDICDIRYTPRVKFAGKSGYDFVFDFVIPKSRQRPERLVQTMNVSNRQSALALIGAWGDTREARPAESQLYAFINDSEQPAPASVQDALRNYGVRPVVWSVRDEVRYELAE